jgi:hypothetical protein
MSPDEVIATLKRVDAAAYAKTNSVNTKLLNWKKYGAPVRLENSSSISNIGPPHGPARGAVRIRSNINSNVDNVKQF